jgi:hypothetical protein
LGIAVHKQCALLGDSETGGEVYGGCRFTDTALLVGDCDDSGHGEAVSGVPQYMAVLIQEEKPCFTWNAQTAMRDELV